MRPCPRRLCELRSHGMDGSRSGRRKTAGGTFCDGPSACQLTTGFAQYLILEAQTQGNDFLVTNYKHEIETNYQSRRAGDHRKGGSGERELQGRVR